MREHHAFRQPRGSTRVRERDDVIDGVDGNWWWCRRRIQQLAERARTFGRPEHVDVLDAGLRGRFLRLVEEGRHRDEQARAAVLELAGELARRVERVDGRDRAAERGDRVKNDRVLRQVRAVDREDVALLEAAPRQRRRHAPDAVCKRAVRERASARAVDQRRFVGEPRCLAQDEVGDGDVRDRDVGTGAPDDHARSFNRAGTYLKCPRSSTRGSV